MVSRPLLPSMAAFPADHFRGFDTVYIRFPAALSPLDTIPSPELHMIKIDDRADDSRHGVSARSGNSLNHALLSPPEGNSKDSKDHIDRSINPPKNICHFTGCGKSFTRRGHLKRHMRA